MKAIVVVGLCEVIIIWIIATCIPFGIFLLRVGNGVAGARCAACLGFPVKTS